MRRTYHFRLKLKAILHERGMTQKELAEITGLREATISEIAANARTTINKKNLAKVMNALDIEDLSEILTVYTEEEY